MYDRTSPSRRQFLRATAASTALAGGVGTVVGQAQVEFAETYRLGGVTPGWRGIAPEGIAGETNPPLDLEPGERYRVIWENQDGVDHNFVVMNADGDELVRTEVIGELGETQTVDFVAEPDMAVYFCEVHPAAMRGRLATGVDREERAPPERDVPVEGTVGLETVATDLNAPLAFEHAAGTRYVVDQTGQIYRLGRDGIGDEPFLDIEDRMVDLGVDRLRGYDERGLLGLAFHPEFQQNRRFFVRYSAPPGEPKPAGAEIPVEPDHDEVLAEFSATEDGASADPESERVLLRLPSPQMNHNGGAVTFGPDGLLYTSLGDGGAADDVGPGHVEDWYEQNRGGNGQDVSSNLWGSILRLDVDSEGGSSSSAQTQSGDDQQGGQTDRGYAVPEDNPLVGELDHPLDLQYAWGFRNPWRMSFNGGELVVADVGQNLWEEIDVVTAGGNYGWNVKEGAYCFSTDHPTEPPEQCPDETPDGEPLIDPIAQFRHPKSTTAFIDGTAVIGGYTYTNDTVDPLQNSYVFGDWSVAGVVAPEGEILYTAPPDGQDVDAALQEAAESPPDELWQVKKVRVAGTGDGKLNRYVWGMGRDGNGDIYVLTSGDFRPVGGTGAVHRIVPEEQAEDVTGMEVEGGEILPGAGDQTDGNQTAGDLTDGNQTTGQEQPGGNVTAGTAGQDGNATNETN